MITRLAVAVALWLASVGGAAWYAFQAGKDTEIASQYREIAASEKAAQVAAQAAAKAIAAIEVKNTTINTKLQREVVTREVFRDCASGPEAVKLLNSTPGVRAVAEK